MARLKSKTGCLTCLARKKKCDEEKPICGTCKRLDIACVRRDDQNGATSTALVITQTNLKAKTLFSQIAVSDALLPFRNDLEKHFTMTSPTALKILVSKVADRSTYLETRLFARFCLQSLVVRHALMAFQAYSKGDVDTALTSYQKCVLQLQRNRAYEYQDPAEMDHALTAICFLGLLEGLKLGDPRNTIAHFEMCRKLLVNRLKRRSIANNPELLQLYRQVAECVMFNIAYLAPYVPDVLTAAKDWDTTFEELLPENDDRVSPFLGGFPGLYHVMFQIIVLLRQTQDPSSRPVDQSIKKTYEALWQQLDKHELSISTLYRQTTADAKSIGLYRAKYAISIHALRIHLIKIARPSTTGEDYDIRRYLRRSIAIMDQQDIVEELNPALVWPLIVLACATESDVDFEFVAERMAGVAVEQDPANNGRLLSALATLRRFRESGGIVNGLPLDRVEVDACQLDFLLEPLDLVYSNGYSPQSRFTELPDESPAGFTQPQAATAISVMG